MESLEIMILSSKLPLNKDISFSRPTLDRMITQKLGHLVF
jgi:hypothetical protein